MQKTILYFSFIVAFVALAGLFSFPLESFAQVDVGLEPVGQELGLGTTDIRVTIANIIRVFMGILGIVAVGIVLYGGFVWMTASGDASKVETAKKILFSGTIGLIIVLSSYAIASFVISSVLDATDAQPGGGGAVGGPGPGGGIGPGGGGLPNNAFIVNSFSPQGNVPIRNVSARVTFSKTVDASTVPGNIIIRDDQTNQEIPGTLSTNQQTVTFVPDANCPAPNNQENCFAANGSFRVSVVGGITGVKSTDGTQISCGVGAPCTSFFQVGNSIDIQDPTVQMTDPIDGMSVSVDSLVDLRAQATDDAGVSLVSFFVDGNFLLSDGPLGNTPTMFSAQGIWDTTNLAINSTHRIFAEVNDINNHQASSPEINVTIRGAHCFNAVQDEDEVGVDCGGAECGACAGGACQNNQDCQNDLCINGICVDAPLISALSPDNGAEGNIITIAGRGFGNQPGEIVFLGQPGDQDDVIAQPAAICGPGAWSQNQILVEVPAGATSGPIQVTEKVSGQDFFDNTSNDRGYIGDFQINDILRPGLCSIDPLSGTYQTEVTLQGQNFGDTPGEVLFGGIQAGGAANITWSDTQISQAFVPNIASGNVDVWVDVSGELSNAVRFNVEDIQDRPNIAYMHPTTGAPGQYITINGSNFGFDIGLVEFTSAIFGDFAADVSFPQECSENYWQHDRIIVKVPQIPSNSFGAYNVKATSSDGIESNLKTFNVANVDVQPGICHMEPDNGPQDTVVRVYGDNFGSQTGSMNFFDQSPATITDWQNQFVLTSVPQDADSGPVQLVDAQSFVSNTFNFEVNNCLNGIACGVGEECCSNGVCQQEGACNQVQADDYYRWSFTTGEIPTPLEILIRYPECNEACRNAAIGAQVTTAVNPITFGPQSGQLYRCVDGPPCQNLAAENTVNYLYQFDAQQGFHDISFQAAQNLQPLNYYRVILTDEIESDQGLPLQGLNYDSDGDQISDSVSWVFQVQDGDIDCQIDRVEVNPQDYTSEVRNEVIAYNTNVFGEPDVCSPNGQRLNPNAYTWNWTNLDANIADFVAFSDTPEQEVTTIDQGQTFITAEAVGQNRADMAQLDVDLKIPEIFSITPDSGLVFDDMTTTYITIQGRNFGETYGPGRDVLFTSPLHQASADRQKCFSWKDDEIVIGVPYDPAFQLGDQLLVTVQTERGADTFAAFTMTNQIKPSICKLKPNLGVEGTSVRIEGSNFGDVIPDNSEINFGNFFANNFNLAAINSWSNRVLQTIVPDGVSVNKIIKPYGAVVDARVTLLSDRHSNTKDILLEPFINSISPDTGAPSTWITLRGGNFGDDPGAQGAVIFKDASGNDIVVDGDFGLPSFCGDNWSDAQIIVKVPNNAVPELVRVRTAAGLLTTDARSRQFFVDTNGIVGPGLCNLNPDTIFRGDALTLQGDNFGDGLSQNDLVFFAGNADEAVDDLGEIWSNQSISINSPSDVLEGPISVQKEVSLQTGRQCVGGVLIGENCINGTFQPIIENRLLRSNELFLAISQNQIPLTCGNGVFEPGQGEQCDESDPQDVNQANCVNCQILGQPGNGICGDNVLQQPNGNQDWEMCDLGVGNGQCQIENCCTLDCQLIGPNNGVCGDGQINPGDGEECDLGAQNGQPQSACTIDCRDRVNNCANAVCGNNIVEFCQDPFYEEECDGGPNCDAFCSIIATCQQDQTVCGQNCCDQGIACDTQTNTCANQQQCGPFQPNICGQTCCATACVDGLCPAQLNIIDSFPLPDDVDICRNVQITATFDQEVSTNTLINRVFLDDPVGGVNFAVGYNEAANQVTVTPQQVLDPNETYSIRFGSGIQSTSGETLLASQEWEFTTKSDICRVDNVRVSIHPESPNCSNDNFLATHYTFDEEINDLTVFDQSGANVHGDIIAVNDQADKRTTDGVRRNALRSTTADRIAVDIGPNPRLPSATDITLSMWINPSSYPAITPEGHVLFWNGAPESHPSSVIPFTAILDPIGNIRTAGHIGWRYVGRVPLNEWSHFVLVVEDGWNMRTYLNGQLTATWTRPNDVTQNWSYWRIGDTYNVAQANDATYLTFNGWDGAIDEVKFYNKALTDEEIRHCTSDLFSCAGDDCAFDADSRTSGNQHEYFVQARDADGQTIAANYQWAEIDEDDIFETNSLVGDTIEVTSHNVNGIGSLVCQAVGAFAGSGSAEQIVTISNNMCENPWGYTDNAYHVAFNYCADRGDVGLGDDLPLLLKTTITNPPQLPPRSGCENVIILRDVIFNNPSGEDAIGMRVFNNPQHLQPRLWYDRCAPNPGTPTTREIAGYQALQDGQTTYVFAGNVTEGGNFYTNVYVFSISDNASSDMFAIMEQVLNNVTFNINIPTKSAKQQITRDVKRLSDIQRIGELLDRYFAANGQYPQLQQGTFVPGVTYSTWPSWQTLGNILGEALPVDPINSFNDCPGYDSQTCYDQTQDPEFANPGGFVYSYSAGQGVQFLQEF